jgi:ADP-ribosyl-[dinitrogen reductase] hydrolase
MRDRAVASVLGLAIGDALGAPFEFRRSADIPTGFTAYTRSWMGLAPGAWTDDTAMARNLWLSLIAHGGALDTADVLARHVAWLRSGRPTWAHSPASSFRARRTAPPMRHASTWNGAAPR